MSTNYLPKFSLVIAALRDAFTGKRIAAKSTLVKDTTCFLSEGASIRLESSKPTSMSKRCAGCGDTRPSAQDTSWVDVEPGVALCPDCNGGGWS